MQELGKGNDKKEFKIDQKEEKSGKNRLKKAQLFITFLCATIQKNH